MLFMKTENSKTNESNKFRCFTDKLNCRNSSKNIALINLRVYYMWKNIKSAYKRITNSRYSLHRGMMLDESDSVSDI